MARNIPSSSPDQTTPQYSRARKTGPPLKREPSLHDPLDFPQGLDVQAVFEAMYAPGLYAALHDHYTVVDNVTLLTPPIPGSGDQQSKATKVQMHIKVCGAGHEVVADGQLGPIFVVKVRTLEREEGDHGAWVERGMYMEMPQDPEEGVRTAHNFLSLLKNKCEVVYRQQGNGEQMVLLDPSHNLVFDQLGDDNISIEFGKPQLCLDYVEALRAETARIERSKVNAEVAKQREQWMAAAREKFGEKVSNIQTMAEKLDRERAKKINALKETRKRVQDAMAAEQQESEERIRGYEQRYPQHYVAPQPERAKAKRAKTAAASAAASATQQVVA